MGQGQGGQFEGEERGEPQPIGFWEDDQFASALLKTTGQQVQVQEFYGKTKNEVLAQLKSSGFEIGRILFIPDIGRNVVRRLKSNGKTLKEGDKLDKHSIIDVVLGNGRGR